MKILVEIIQWILLISLFKIITTNMDSLWSHKNVIDYK
jgi:hypothetical protein